MALLTYGRARRALRVSLNPQYNLKDLPGASEFKSLFTIQQLLPERR